MSYDYEEMFGEIVGHGAQATVYAKGEYAVKLYRDGYPKRNVFSEAFVMVNLESMNLPFPKVYEILSMGGRYGLRMDRVKGKMLGEDYSDPLKIEGAIDTVIDLQLLLQKCTLDSWAPTLKGRFHDDLVLNDRLSSELKNNLMELLRELPDGDSLCHCDFHGGNIFFDGVNYTILDLLQICKGNPIADAVCSYVSHYLLHPGIGELYMNKYCMKSGVSKEDMLQWLPVYAGTLLGQLPEQYTPTLERFIAREAME